MADSNQANKCGEASIPTPTPAFSFAFSKAPSFKTNQPSRQPSKRVLLSPLHSEEAEATQIFVPSESDSGYPASHRDQSAQPAVIETSHTSSTRQSATSNADRRTHSIMDVPSVSIAQPDASNVGAPLLKGKMPNFTPAPTTHGDSFSQASNTFSRSCTLKPATNPIIATSARRLSGSTLGTSGLQQRLLLRKQHSMGTSSQSNMSPSFFLPSEFTKPLFSEPFATRSILSRNENILPATRPSRHSIPGFPTHNARLKQVNRQTELPSVSIERSPDALQENCSVNVINTLDSPIPPSTMPPKGSEIHSHDSPLMTHIDAKDRMGADWRSSTVTRDRSLSRAPTESSRPAAGSKTSLIFNMMEEMESENTILKADVARLTSNIELLSAEKSELSSKLYSLKEKSVKSIQQASYTVDAFKVELDALKEQSRSTQLTLGDVQASKAEPEPRSERMTKDWSCTEIEPLVHDSGETLSKASTSREMINEIRQQHVIDLLREQLESCFGALAEARDRVASLESEQSETRETLSRSSMEIASAGARMTGLSDELRRQQQETIESLLRAERGEVAYNASQAMLEQNDNTMREQEQLIQNLRADLATTSESRDALQKEYHDAIPLMRRRLEELSHVEQSLPAKNEHIQHLEAQVSSLIHHGRESTLKDSVIEQLRAEKRVSDSDLGGLKAKCETLDALRASEVQYALRDERRRDQETLIAEWTSKVAKLTAEWTGSVARSASLEGSLSEARASLGRRDADFAVQQNRSNVQAEAISTLNKTVAELKAELVQKTAQTESLQLELARAESFVADQKQQVQQTQLVLTTTKISVEALNAKLDVSEAKVKELMEAETKQVPQNDGELDALKNEKVKLEEQLKLAEDEKGAREAGMKTLITRFQTGETLSDQESILVRDIIQLSRTLYEKELVTKGNEIRRRNNQIAELTSRMKQFETALIKTTGDQANTGNALNGTSEAGTNLFNSTPISSLLELGAEPAMNADSSPTPVPAQSTPRQAKPQTPIPQTSVATTADATTIVAANATTVVAPRPARRIFADMNTTSPEEPVASHFGEDGSDDYVPPSSSKQQQTKQPKQKFQGHAEGSRAAITTTRRHTKRTFDEIEEDEIEDVDEQEEQAGARPIRQRLSRVLEAFIRDNGADANFFRTINGHGSILHSDFNLQRFFVSAYSTISLAVQ
ncbi:hypothetical protein FRB97_006946 [Tulasnella sp. 331]|nr:hypothetical protein FRB97_006946 [Tulasnella sp. 331]